MLRIAIANQKGGVAKTVTVANLGMGLAQAGHSALLVDLDPQANLSLAFGATSPELTTADLLNSKFTSVAQVATSTGHDRLSLCPTSDDLAAADVRLAREPASRRSHACRVLRSKLEADAELPDFVLIDCPPSLGFLTLNALTAADFVLVPVQCSFLAMQGLRLLLETVENTRAAVNPELEILGILLTMHDKRTLHAAEVVERVRDHFGELVFDTTIPRTVRFDDATVAGQPILAFSKRSPGAEAYRELTKEVLRRAKAQARA